MREERDVRQKTLLAAAGALAFAGMAVACADIAGLTGGKDEDPPIVSTPGSPCGSVRCVHGTCKDEGRGVCECTAGFSGALCDSCGNDLQDKDGDGKCEPSCALTQCPARSKCDDASGKATCVCATGYALAGGACVWQGGFKDQGFQNSPAGAWQLTGGATIEPKADAGADPGFATFPQYPIFGPLPDAGAPCMLGTNSHATQTVKMPSLAESEPFALQLSRQIVCDNSYFYFCYGEAYSFTAANRVIFSDRADGYAPTGYLARKQCVGERAYGGDVTFDVSAPCGYQINAVRLDRASLVPDPSCPTPGTVVNGSFEDTGGWIATGGAEVAALIGTGQSRGGRLKIAKACDSATLTGSLSVPYKSIERAALSFTVKGPSTKSMTVRIGGQTSAQIRGTGVFESAKICLPDWSSGTAQQLQLALTGKYGVCADPDDADFTIDDMKVVSEPTCESPGLVIDGGFERGATSTPWVLPTTGGSIVTNNPAQAHTGNGYASLYSANCGYISMSQTVSVPDIIPGKGGPQVSFWYRTLATTNPQYFSSAGSLTPAATWTKKTQCILPATAGRAFGFYVATQATGAPCSPPYLYLDDVSTQLDPTCPEK